MICKSKNKFLSLKKQNQIVHNAKLDPLPHGKDIFSACPVVWEHLPLQMERLVAHYALLVRRLVPAPRLARLAQLVLI